MMKKLDEFIYERKKQAFESSFGCLFLSIGGILAENCQCENIDETQTKIENHMFSERSVHDGHHKR